MNEKPIKSVTVSVSVVKKIRIDVMPSALFGGTEEKLISDWSRDLWTIKSMDDVVKYAAEIAFNGRLYSDEDGLGRVVYRGALKNDGKDNYVYVIEDEDTDFEILE